MGNARGPVLLGLAGIVWVSGLLAGTAQAPLTPSALRNHAAIRYQQRPLTDDVSKLIKRIEAGEVSLSFQPTSGYLESALKALDISIDSQMLVFSKTSFQARRINPSNPRAIYFNDTTSVGWVRGGDVLEFAAQDPEQGAVFYTLEQKPDGPPRFSRDQVCVPCHTWEATLDVPGMFVSTVVPAADGSVVYAHPFGVDHRTPWQLRWGGWYVTGRHPIEQHLGNAMMTPETSLDGVATPQSLHVTSLDGRFDPTGYPSLQSDLVSLMVLDHQTRMLNLITRLNWDARIGAEAGRPRDAAIEELVDYMLFVDEERLPGPTSGTSTFAATFAARGPRDRQGRSLRDLDLRTRLQRYPCSFVIYAPSFEALPADVRQAIYTRLWQVLSGQDTDARYAGLTAADRRAIVEILRDTKSDLPAFFGSKM